MVSSAPAAAQSRATPRSGAAPSRKARPLFLHALRRTLGSTRLLLASAALFVASQVSIIAILQPLGPANVLRAQTTFSKETLLAIVEQWQRQGVLGSYHQHFLLDVIHPLWYALLLAALLARGLDRQGLPERWSTVLLLPFFAGALDLAENALHLLFLSDLGAVTQQLVTLSALAANLKWVSIVVSIALVLALRPWRSAPA